MKKVLCVILVAILALAMAGCGKTKTLHCDGCDKEITVKEDSNMNEDWIVYCEECEPEIEF